MEKYVCIHGHFYQPPRENPWLESVELQDSAYPYHDWNDRITAECYGPNTASRLLDAEGRIVGIVNNYSRMSFNVGPTLLSWMEAAHPEIYAAIIEADRRSLELYGGHGSAIAQCYNHIIMPLASIRDKRTQIAWGIEDFRRRFGRDPEGIWLPETAVDHETLELLVEAGIKFTILAPRQAAEVRDDDETAWRKVTAETVDPRKPYWCVLPSGERIALFFYDGPIAQDLAFAGLLHNGEYFAQRLNAAFGSDDADNLLVHVATDGETYGHHHKRGEMALSYCLHLLEEQKLAKVTVYGEFLEKFPPKSEVRIHEKSSWSCVHGIERWTENCGCSSGMRQGWHQRWRKPLRVALDRLRAVLDPHFESKGGEFFHDPWKARDEYVQVLLDRSEENVDRYLDRHAKHELSDSEKTTVLRLLEMQRHAMLMYTSCGWFFDEVSGIETTQIMRYAARAMQLAQLTDGPDHEPDFMAQLRDATSNLPEHENGELVYNKYIKTSAVDVLRVGAHYAVSSLFMDYEPQARVYSYQISDYTGERHEAGKFRLAIGRLRIKSTITWEETEISYAALHLGDQNASGGVREYLAEENFLKMKQDLLTAFRSGDIPETLRELDRHFENHHYSMWHLFRDEQRKLLEFLFEETESRIENSCRQMYQDHYQLMQAKQSLEQPQPEVLMAAARFVLNRDLRRVLSTVPIDEDQYQALVQQVKKWNIEIDSEVLGLIGTNQTNELVAQLQEDPLDYTLLKHLESLLTKYQELQANLNLWRSQNIVYEIGLQQYYLRQKLAEKGQKEAAHWVTHFRSVSNLLGVKLA